MPVCCDVMYAEMLDRVDDILAAPPKGKGASLTANGPGDVVAGTRSRSDIFCINFNYLLEYTRLHGPSNRMSINVSKGLRESSRHLENPGNALSAAMSDMANYQRHHVRRMSIGPRRPVVKLRVRGGHRGEQRLPRPLEWAAA